MTASLPQAATPPSPSPDRRTVLSAGVTAGLAVGVAGTVSAPAPRAGAEETTSAYRLQIDPRNRRQTIEGFGASGAWWSQVLGTWSAPARDRVARLLFSTHRGIGLSQYRYNIGAGIDETIDDPWRTAETFEVEAGVYDWERDAGARWFLQAAKDHGVEDFVAFVNSPPRRLTANGHTYGTPGDRSNLPPENYEEFTRYLLDIVQHFRDSEGIDFHVISPINEPQWDWDEPGQEGCHYEPEDVRDLTATVIEAFASSDLSTTVSAPESGEYEAVHSGESYADVLLSDARIREGLGEFAVHSYWSTDEQRRLAAEHMSSYPEHPMSMTEWCEMVNGRDSGMDSALTLARTVHADLTLADAVCWQYWIAVSRYDYRDGLLYTDHVEPGDEENIEETKRLWALGNFSRFIRPGAERIDATTRPPELTEGTLARIPFVTPEHSAPSEAGDRIFRIDDPSGDDAGPGTYTYPHNEAFTPGSFDLRSITAVDDGDDVLLTIQVGADLEDPWGDSPVGYDLQVFDIYIDTGSDSGFTELLPGRRALVEEGHSWDRAVFATGRTDVASQEVRDKVSAEMQEALFVPEEAHQSISGDSLTIRVPKSFLGEPGPDWSYQVLVLGSDGNAEPDSLRIREVLEEATEWNFGGGSDGPDNPNILDLLTPGSVSQADALAWTEGERSALLTSAYVHETDGDLVVVVINESEQPQEIELSLPHRSSRIRVTPHRTSDEDDLRPLQSIWLTGDGSGMVTGMTTVSARSVTTFTAAHRD